MERLLKPRRKKQPNSVSIVITPRKSEIDLALDIGKRNSKRYGVQNRYSLRE